MKNKSLNLLVALIISFIGFPILSQTINFKHFGIEEGLIHPTIYTISQDKSGFVWLGTGAGACRFDGVHFSIPSSIDTLPEVNANTSFIDKSGNVWLGYDDGSVCSYKKRKLERIYKNTESPSKINCFSESPDGSIIAVSQNSGFCILQPGSAFRY